MSGRLGASMSFVDRASRYLPSGVNVPADVAAALVDLFATGADFLRDRGEPVPPAFHPVLEAWRLVAYDHVAARDGSDLGSGQVPSSVPILGGGGPGGDDAGDDWISATDAAAILDCSDSYVRRIARSLGGRQPHPGGAWRFPRSAIDQRVAKRTEHVSDDHA